MYIIGKTNRISDDLSKEDQESWVSLDGSAESGNVERVKRLAKKSSQIKVWGAMRVAARHGNEECLSILIKCSKDAVCFNDLFHRYFSEALKLSAEKGHVECVRLLLSEGANHKSSGSFALIQAARKGHVECARLLLPVSDPLVEDCQALRLAAYGGHTECLKLLLPVSDAKARSSISLRWAAEFGYVECVKLLLPASDAKACGSRALINAADAGHVECVKLLAQPSGFGLVVDEIIESMMSEGLDWDDFNELLIIQRVREEAMALQSSTPVAQSSKKSRRL